MPKTIEKVVEVMCRNCGYTWETNPLRWKNMQFIEREGKRVKVVRCPTCGTAIGLTRDEVLRILRSRGK
jgi:predicted Zn-ribbon and HTH transcriptional regulator